MYHSKVQVQNNVLFGVEFGYPDCCIKYFHIRQLNGDLFKEMSAPSERKLTGTGYICCDECNEKYTEAELTDKINHRRLRVEPFPLQNDESIDRDKAEKIERDKVAALIEEIIEESEKYITLEDC